MPEDEREARRQAREARAVEVAQARVQKQRQLDEALTQERAQTLAIFGRPVRAPISR